MNSSRKKILDVVAALSLLAGGMAYGSCFIEAEQFADRGGWAVDSQFIDQMGSSFLLAHGMGKPVTDATTTFDCRAAGTYYVWARTRNWTAPWSEHAAGTFMIKVNGAELPNVLGRGTGDWQWQKAGEVTLERGPVSVALHDLTGFDGRCDVVCLSPVDGTPVMPAVKLAPPRRVKADLVVCGGGIAGTCAAIAAARLGLKVALVQDRPMLGGANSSEVRVHLGGYMNLGPYPRLGDVVAEIGPAKGGNAQPAERYEDARKLDAVAAEKNIQLFLNTRVRWASKTGDRLASVTGQDVVTGARIEFEAPLFADCTGDACVGALAGADFRMGRESKAETGEEMAPDVADKMTMGASVQWYTKDAGRAVAFPAEPWMIAFNEQNCEYGLRGDWDWETGMMRDQISEFERIRDYGMLVVYSNWSYLKNKSEKRAKYANRAFEWVAYVAGKRESRRLMGDHVLTQQDVFDFVPYPDGTCCTTWAIDLHYPMPRNTKHYDGEPFRSICTHNKHYAYPIPYRCLYSRNVANLFMAGRNISVTHVALGTVRVMRTTGMMGEVVGMAARVCKDHACLPRGVYESHLDELKALMAKGVGTGKPQPPQNYNRGALIPGGPAALPFTYTVETVETNAEYVVERFVYPSPVPPSFPEAKDVVAYCYRPVGLPPGRRPAVLCLHILGGNGSITRAIASSYASRGLTALMPLMPMFLERTPACGRLTDLASPEGPRHLGETFRAVPHDIRRSLDVLASLPEVDPKRIGLIGTSLGGILGVSAATDARVQKAAFLLAGGDLESILQSGNHEVQPIAACLARANASERAVLDEAMRTLEPLRAAPALAEKVKAGRIRMFNAAEDEVVPPANTRRLAEALGLAGGSNFTLIPDVGHYTAILKLPEILDETAEFFGGADLKPRPPRPNRSDDATVKGVFAQLNKLVSGDPQTGRVHRVGVKVDVVRGGAVAFAGFASFLFGPDGRFALSVDDLGFQNIHAIRLGRGDRLWAESAKGTVFHGDAASRAVFTARLGMKARRVHSAAILLTALVAQSGNLALFDKFVKLSLRRQGDARAIVLAGDGFTAEVALDPARNVPAGVFYKKGGDEVRVVFTEWQLDAPYRAADFEPRAGAPRRAVDAATLDDVVCGLLDFALEGGLVK